MKPTIPNVSVNYELMVDIKCSLALVGVVLFLEVVYVCDFTRV